MESIDKSKIVFIDIETVSQKKSLDDNTDNLISLWGQKHRVLSQIHDIGTPAESYREKCGIFAEFGKIVCISIGLYDKNKDEYRIKSLYDDTEKTLLNDFVSFAEKLSANHIFSGHNIKEFDIPFICRRLIVNRLNIPKVIDFQSKKPWEIKMYDTLQMWKFGDFKNYTSLNLLTEILGVPSPKSDIDGSEVGRVYWEEKDLERIKKYCENDVKAQIQLFNRLNNEPLVDEEKIVIV